MTGRMGLWVTILIAVGILGASVLSTSVPSVWAGSATWGGTLSGASPTYNRLNPNNCNLLATSVGTNVFYSTQSFTVGVTGFYTLTNETNSFTQTGGFAGDSFFVLYQTSFDPASPT